MANPSISIDDETLAKFDYIREQMKAELPPGATLPRSAVMQDLMEDWIDENAEYLEDFEGNPNRVPAMAD